MLQSLLRFHARNIPTNNVPQHIISRIAKNIYSIHLAQKIEHTYVHRDISTSYCPGHRGSVNCLDRGACYSDKSVCVCVCERGRYSKPGPAPYYFPREELVEIQQS
jgi:hypothetical protein